MRRVPALAAASGCLALAAFLSLLALDVARRETSFQADDVVFRAEPRGADRWQPVEIVPFGAARALLGVDDDLAYRRTLQLVRRASPRAISYEQSELIVLRARAQTQLSLIVRRDGDPGRRSAAATLLGVFALSLAVIDDSLRPTLLADAAADFRRAVTFDPENEDAKYNLELALDRLATEGGGGGARTSAGRTFNQGAGAGSGREGAGY